MRVPIPIVLLLVCSVIGGTWWAGTRQKDFLTPPSAEELAAIQTRVESSFPQTEKAADAISEKPAPEEAPPAPPPPPPEPPKPEIDLGDLSTPPVLTLYGERSTQGPEHLIALAAALEEKGQFQRALLAWERVIDLTRPSPAQLTTALAAIRRLRPTLPDWHAEATDRVPVILHAGTGKRMAKALQPILDQAARDIEVASAGTLKVTTKITAGKSNVSAKGPTPVAVWLTGANKDGNSTDVASFTAESADASAPELLKTSFQLIRSQISRTTSFTPPAELAAEEAPMDALTYRLSRLCWHEFGATLNLPSKKEEPPKKKP